MTTRNSTNSSKKTRTKRRALPSSSAPREPKKARTGLNPEPATPKPEPTFTLSQIARLFGDTYGGDFDPALTVAINALDDVRRSVRVCIEALPHQGDDSPIDPVCELLEQVWARAETGCEVLNKCRVRALQTTEGGAS